MEEVRNDSSIACGGYRTKGERSAVTKSSEVCSSSESVVSIGYIPKGFA